MTQHRYVGRLSSGPAGYLQFNNEQADVPRHLKLIYLETWACRSAKLGDRVEVEYRKTGAGYGYVVTEVLL